MAYPRNPLPVTKHSVFYSYSISINSVEIGSFERFSATSSRTIERIREILFSRGPLVKEIVWGGTDISVSISRVEMYRKNVLQAIGFEIFSLEDFNQPVDIHELQMFPGTFETRLVTYAGCVASEMGKEVDTGTARIIETMTFQCSTIIGTVGAAVGTEGA